VKIFLGRFLPLLLFLTAGCSVFKPSHQTVAVQVTNPPHAEVWVNNKFVGEAPVQTSVRRDHTVFVLVKQEGFQPATHSIGFHPNATGILDAIGAYLFFVPFVGIVAPGHVSLDETSITMQLVPTTNAPVDLKSQAGTKVNPPTTNEPVH